MVATVLNDLNKMEAAQVVAKMRECFAARVGYDGRTGEYNYTAIVEAVADALERWEWLDDPEHDVWFLVVDVAAEEGAA